MHAELSVCPQTDISLPVELFKVTETVPLGWWCHHIVATTAGCLPNREKASWELRPVQPPALWSITSAYSALSMHSFCVDDCCTLLANKLNCTEVNQAAHSHAHRTEQPIGLHCFSSLLQIYFKVKYNAYPIHPNHLLAGKYKLLYP